MTMLLGTWRSLFGGRRKTYADKVISYNPLVYYQMNEAAGAVAVNYGTLGAAANGAYTGVTLNSAVGPDGVSYAPFFDGANDYLDFFTAAFDAAFDGHTGTLMIWCRVNAAGVWTDGVLRKSISIVDDANNYYVQQKAAVVNRMDWAGAAGAGTPSVALAPINPTTWVHVALTWSDGANADQFKAFYAGAQTGATSAALNIWNGGGLTATQTNIGCLDNTVPSQVWHGWLAHAAVWDRVLTPAEIAILATPTP